MMEILRCEVNVLFHNSYTIPVIKIGQEREVTYHKYQRNYSMKIGAGVSSPIENKGLETWNCGPEFA